MKVRIRRSDLRAKGKYDFRRLEEKNHLFLPCRIEEEKETVCMNFDLRGMQIFEELKKEERLTKLAVLLQVAELEELYRKYEFSLEPGNLYYDLLGRVRVKLRDIITTPHKSRMKNFLRQYQALIGYILEGSRPYEDYLYGGLKLLKPQEEAASFMEPETVQEEKQILSEYYSQLLEKEKKHMRKVEVRNYRRLVRYSMVSACLLFLLIIAFAYSFGWYMPRQERLREAKDDYICKDYLAMIDALKGFETEELSRAEKYMLATAYIQGQVVDTFSAKDKENILSKVTYQSNEKVLDYWIHLGRLEVDKAEDLAMTMSDDQLLLYAYMHELHQVEEGGLSGEAKKGRRQELIKEIEELAGKLGLLH
ncbi:MAG: hypothetical protein HFG82_05195 [Dorea sp.]|jgi:type VII secretion protein EssB|nr:hypothetical protein [Dorea sp.]